MSKKTNKSKRRHGGVSIRARYTAMLSLIILACFSLLGFSLAAFAGSYWYSQNEALLSENAKSIAETSSSLLSGGYISMFGDGDTSIAMLCSSLGVISDAINADVFICDTTGHIIVCRDYFVNGVLVGNYCEIHDNLVMTKEAVDGASAGSYSMVSTLGGQFSGLQYIVGEPVKVAGVTVATVFAVAPVSNSVISFVLPIIELFCFAVAVALVFGIIAVYRTSRSFTKPLELMADATRSYASGDFTPRINIERSDEIGELATAFNTMAGSLAQLESSRRSFVANVSHELKTPMTTIGGFIDGMLDGTIPPMEQDHYLRVVSKEVKRLSRIVVSMLNLSKIEAGQLELNFTKVNLSDMVLGTFLNFEKKINDGKIDIRGIESLGAHYVRADSDMLSQVIYNLVDNAVKFTPEHGYISVSITENDGFIETAVTNSGTGVAPEELSMIFERFYKVDKSRSYDAKSTGLGLYIVKSILDLHGGTVSAESEEGRYTRFVFRLPK